MSENSSLKNFSFVTLGRIITAGLYSGFYLIFATILEPETFGQMSYIIAIAGTASIISRFGFPLSVVVYRAKENHDLSNQLNVLSVITTSAAALILFFTYRDDIPRKKKYQTILAYAVLVGVGIFVFFGIGIDVGGGVTTGGL